MIPLEELCERVCPIERALRRPENLQLRSAVEPVLIKSVMSILPGNLLIEGRFEANHFTLPIIRPAMFARCSGGGCRLGLLQIPNLNGTLKIRMKF